MKRGYRMISHEPRCIYDKNPLAEVICQLRFPEILSIQTDIPAKFQDAIRKDFPKYVLRKEQLPNQNSPTNNYQFVSADGFWRVNLTSKFISLACCKYTCWEDFAHMLDKPLAAFIQIYEPAYFERVGLRYVNFISRKKMDLEGVPFKDLMESCYLGILAEDEVTESATTRCAVDVETALRGGCRVKIHAGLGQINRGGKMDPEVKFIFDQDLFMPGNIPINMSAGALQTLHAQSYGIFRGAITDMLHKAMGPS